MTFASVLSILPIRMRIDGTCFRRIAAGVILLCFMPCGMPAHAGTRDNHLPHLPTLGVKLGTKKFTLWVAATAAQQDRGLMYIRHLPVDHGMLFYFRHPVIGRFWMKHTLIPLDILYIRKSGKIVNCFTMPPDNGKKVFLSSRRITVAIELAGGTIHRLGLHPGQVLRLPQRRLLRDVSIADGEAAQP